MVGAPAKQAEDGKKDQKKEPDADDKNKEEDPEDKKRRLEEEAAEAERLKEEALPNYDAEAELDMKGLRSPRVRHNLAALLNQEKASDPQIPFTPGVHAPQPPAKSLNLHIVCVG